MGGCKLWGGWVRVGVSGEWVDISYGWVGVGWCIFRWAGVDGESGGGH